LAYLKLIDSIKSTQSIPVIITKSVSHSGQPIKYSSKRVMKPKEKYAIPDDELLYNSLINYKVTARKTDALVNTLNGLGIKYEEKVCPTCGGRVIKLLYPIVEVVKDGE
jgi:hypothetical protein